MKLTALLLDDEIYNSKLLQYEIEHLDLNFDLEIVAIHTNPEEALEDIIKLSPDILFLDIEMPQMNGFELLDHLGPNLKSKVIFVTAFDQYALKAFEYYAIDYLLKPIDQKRLRETLSHVESSKRVLNNSEIKELSELIEHQLEKPKSISIPVKNGFQLVLIEDILRCQADRNYTLVHLKNGKNILVSKSLVYFEKLLTDLEFIRVHQSHLINMHVIDQYTNRDGGYCILSDQTNIPVSRKYKTELISIFKSKLV